MSTLLYERTGVQGVAVPSYKTVRWICDLIRIALYDPNGEMHRSTLKNVNLGHCETISRIEQAEEMACTSSQLVNQKFSPVLSALAKRCGHDREL